MVSELNLSIAMWQDIVLFVFFCDVLWLVCFGGEKRVQSRSETRQPITIKIIWSLMTNIEAVWTAKLNPMWMFFHNKLSFCYTLSIFFYSLFIFWIRFAQWIITCKYQNDMSKIITHNLCIIYSCIVETEQHFTEWQYPNILGSWKETHERNMMPA